MGAGGRLTLRARLLVLLVAVTAAFLLIMGGVSVLALSRRLGAQFDAQLVAAARRPPGQIAANADGYVAVEVALPGRTVRPVTSRSAAVLELAAFAQNMIASHTARLYLGGAPFAVHQPGGPRLRAAARVIRAPGTGGPTGMLIVARPVTAVTGQVRGILIIEVITGGVLIALLALGGRWLIGRGLAPLGQMASTAHRITTRGDLSARMPEAGSDTEVGRLAGAINTMLDRIQQAFGAHLRSEQAVRQFAADASHELRTPLTTIRGYAELYRQGALGPGELPDAMRRIEQEAHRMSALVAELLELARLDRTSSLDLAETDLAEVVQDAAADARAVEPGRPVHVQAPERLIAVVDEARVRQVLANLLGNAREHTPASAAVSVRLALVDGHVLLEVADNGPGMSPDDAARAFDRFYRAAETPGRDEGGEGGTSRRMSGAQRGGSGLGLSIVQAIAQAHGGRAVLDSRPGQGARVRVWLPAAPIDSCNGHLSGATP